MGVEFILGIAVGIATPSAAKKAKAKLKPRLARIVKSLAEYKDS
ncbi:hypothetical protein [Streptomyces sp. M2CJ-2]|nr:hypothetical protein [Streptomyces sp. M2CJ-2]